MKKTKTFNLWSFVSLLILAGGSAYASDVKPTVVIDGNYSYNFNRPGLSTDLVNSPQNAYRYNDRGHNQFNLNQAAIGIKKTDAPVRYEASVWAGTQADVAGREGGTGTTINNIYSRLKVGNVTYGHDNSWTITGGKFTFSSLTFETGDSHGNWNYSRSWGYMIMPKRALGAQVMLSLTETLNLEFTMANGADRHLTNNRGRLFGLNLTFGGEKGTAANIGFTYSPERDNQTGAQRLATAINVSHMFQEDMGIGFAGNLVDARFDGLTAQNQPRTSTRYSLGLYGMMSFFADHRTSLRLEFLKDGQSGFIRNARNNSAFGSTLTHRYMATNNLSFWGEVRWDTSSVALYETYDMFKVSYNLWTVTLAATLEI